MLIVRLRIPQLFQREKNESTTKMTLSTIVSSMEKNSLLNKILYRKESDEIKIEDVIDIDA